MSGVHQKAKVKYIKQRDTERYSKNIRVIQREPTVFDAVNSWRGKLHVVVMMMMRRR